MIEFNRKHRAFATLFGRTDTPLALSEATEPVREVGLRAVIELLAVRAPHRSDAELTRCATVAVQITRALMPLIIASEPAEADWYAEQLRTLLVHHLDRVVNA